jgi:cytoskeletal protein RodZ
MKKKVRKIPSKKRRTRVDSKTLAELDLGQTLLLLRKRKKLSLEQLSGRLKISARRLRAFEKNDFGRLPAPVYVRGYLKQYASFFNIKTGLLFEKYERQALSSQQEIIKRPKPLQQLREGRAPLRLRSLFILSIFLFLGFSSVYIFWQVNSAFSSPAIHLSSPGDNIVVDESVVNVSGKTDSEVDLTINGQAVYADQEGYFNQEIVLKEGLNTIQIKATNNLGRSSQIIKKILYSQ